MDTEFIKVWSFNPDGSLFLQHLIEMPIGTTTGQMFRYIMKHRNEFPCKNLLIVGSTKSGSEITPQWIPYYSI